MRRVESKYVHFAVRFILRADKARSLEAVNAALKLPDSAVNPQYAEFQK